LEKAVTAPSAGEAATWSRKFASGLVVSFDPRRNEGSLGVPGQERSKVTVQLRGGNVVAGATVGGLLRGSGVRGVTIKTMSPAEAKMRRIRARRKNNSGFESLMMMWFFLLWLRLRAGGGAEDVERDERESEWSMRVWRRYQRCIDNLQPRKGARYVILSSFAVFYALRVWALQGFYVVTYMLGIHLLQLLILFLQPAELETVMRERADGEFRPFERKLPEFKLWHGACKAFVVAYICTFVPFFNVPVFWPMLLVYFVMVFGISIHRQVAHMWHYNYVPWTTGSKRTYTSKEGETVSPSHVPSRRD